MSWSTCLSRRVRTRLTHVAVLACATAGSGLVGLGSASAATVHKSSTKTFTLPAHTTRTFDVRYPSALKFAGAKYSCAARVSGLGKKFVTILSRGSALGGTVCRVRARNSASLPSIDTTAAIRVTATTTYSSARRQSNVRTFILPADSLRTFDVGYPSALKFSNARYSCTAKVSGLGARYVTIVSRGSALGGSVCRVRAYNDAELPSLDTTASVQVTATTTH